jgi:hypothetical protein
MARKKIKDGEVWTVLAETSGDGIGLPRGTRILVRTKGRTLELSALGGDWDDDEVPAILEPIEASEAPKGCCDPEWGWQGSVKREDGNDHVVKVGFIRNDPGICTIFVNPDGTATVRR